MKKIYRASLNCLPLRHVNVNVNVNVNVKWNSQKFFVLINFFTFTKNLDRQSGFKSPIIICEFGERAPSAVYPSQTGFNLRRLIIIHLIFI